MAPTRPLVHQQKQAAHEIVGITNEETAEITGTSMNKDKRKELWNAKRVFFATPQVVEIDLRNEIIPRELIKLIVFDEAHKAKGDYAYANVIRQLHQYHKNFRVLALTATAGKSADIIQIIQNLLISKIEYRSEQSIDVQRFTFKKRIELTTVRLSDEQREIYNFFLNYVDPFIQDLRQNNIINANFISKGYLIIEQTKLRSNNYIDDYLKNDLMTKLSIAVGIYHSIEVLERHGIFLFLKSLRDDNNYKYFISKDMGLRRYVNELEGKYETKNPFKLNLNEIEPMENSYDMESLRKFDFGHPKFNILKTKLDEYFKNGGAKVIIFCEYRDSTQLIYTMLLALRPLVKPCCLIGQGKKISQKIQLKTMSDFRNGKINTLVCTCVAEEGLDVGEVDLVICFDINSKVS
jgi:Fanconi anemia group M protein